MSDDNKIILVMKTVSTQHQYLDMISGGHAAARVVLDEKIEPGHQYFDMSFDGIMLECVAYVSKCISLYSAIIEYQKAIFIAAYLYSEWQATGTPMRTIIHKYKEYCQTDNYSFYTDKFVGPYVIAYSRSSGGDKHD